MLKQKKHSINKFVKIDKNNHIGQNRTIYLFYFLKILNLKQKGWFVIYILVITFLLGIIFIQWIIPLVDGIINLFLTQLEVWKSSMSTKIVNYQSEMTKIKKQLEESNTSAIGFVIEEDEENYEE